MRSNGQAVATGRQRFWLDLAIFAPGRFATGCHRLQPRGSIKAPSFVACQGNRAGSSTGFFGPTSAAAVAELKRLGLRPVRLTGDNAHTARAVAAEVGIEDVIADVLRADKAAFVRRLQEGEAPHRACALEEDAPGEEAEEAEASRPLRVIAPFTLARPGWRSAI